MKTRNLVHLALIIFFGLEKIYYSLAIERQGEFEYPFKLPVYDSFGAIHKMFPLQVKFVKEVMHGGSVRREWTLPEVHKGDQENRRQTEQTEPQFEVTKQPAEEKDFKSSYGTIKEKNPYRPEMMKTPEWKTDEPSSSKNNAPEDYDDQVDSLEEDLDGDEDGDEDEDEETEEGAGAAQGATGDPSHSKIPKFPYRITIEVVGPNSQVYRKEKSGYLSEKQGSIAEKENVLSFLKSLRKFEDNEKSKGCMSPKVDESDKLEKETKMPYPVRISSPVLRYASQVMDHNGNLYRSEKVGPLPISVVRYLEKERKNGDPKEGKAKVTQKVKQPEYSDKDDEDSKEEMINDQETTEVESLDNSANEVFSTREKYRQEKEMLMKEIEKSLKEVDERYPSSFESNSKAQVPENKGGPKLEDSSTEDDDEVDEDEELKKVVVIRPGPRIYQASVDVGPPKKSELSSLKVEPAAVPSISDGGSEEFPQKKVMPSEKTQFTFKHFFAPLRQILISKIFGRPGVGNEEPQ